MPNHQTSAAQSATSSHARAALADGDAVSAVVAGGHARTLASDEAKAPQGPRRAEGHRTGRYPARVTHLRFGLVFDLLGTPPAARRGARDLDAEYEPEATIELLEAAVRRARSRCRCGSATRTRCSRRCGKGELPALDVALSIAEGYGTRNREAWAPVLLEMAGVPTLGSDALSLCAVARQGVGAPDRRGRGRPGAGAARRDARRDLRERARLGASRCS